MKRALIVSVLFVACTDPAPSAPPAPPVVTPQVVNPDVGPRPMTKGSLHMKLLGKHLEDAGIEVAGAPRIDAPPWAKARGEPGVVVVEDAQSGFRVEIRAGSLDEIKRAAAAEGRKVARTEADAVVLDDGDTRSVWAAARGLRCGAEGVTPEKVELILRSCRTLR